MGLKVNSQEALEHIKAAIHKMEKDYEILKSMHPTDRQKNEAKKGLTNFSDSLKTEVDLLKSKINE